MKNIKRRTAEFCSQFATRAAFNYLDRGNFVFRAKMGFMSEGELAIESREIAITDESSFEDAPIVCIDCGENFIWTAGEQLFYHDKGLKNPPKRCKLCKQAKNERLSAINSAQNSGVKQKIEVIVNCANCNSQTTVPFYPSQGRPVFCRSCFLAMNPDLLPR